MDKIQRLGILCSLLFESYKKGILLFDIHKETDNDQDIGFISYHNVLNFASKFQTHFSFAKDENPNLTNWNTQTKNILEEFEYFSSKKQKDITDPFINLFDESWGNEF